MLICDGVWATVVRGKVLKLVVTFCDGNLWHPSTHTRYTGKCGMGEFTVVYIYMGDFEAYWSLRSKRRVRLKLVKGNCSCDFELARFAYVCFADCYSELHFAHVSTRVCHWTGHWPFPAKHNLNFQFVFPCLYGITVTGDNNKNNCDKRKLYTRFGKVSLSC